MKIKEILLETRKKYKNYSIWKILIHSDLITSANNLINDANFAVLNNVDQHVSSEILENIVEVIQVIDKIPRTPRSRAFPKVIRNRLQRAYKNLLLKGNANLE